VRRSGSIRLGVNIDHVATLRNARGGIHPDPVDAAKVAITAGADGITAHLREDRRHITDADMERLAALCEEENITLNMELAATEEMVAIAVRLKPHAACIVPERREERTTEGGLDVAGQQNRLVPMIAQLADAGCRVSLFIEAKPHQIDAAASTRAEIVEFHTGAYAHALDDGDEERADAILAQLRDGGRMAQAAGLEVHYGHGLTFENVVPIAQIAEAKELNIGHFIIGEAVFMGLQPAIERMASIILDARVG
jgi:pyridoxine 5-phosphate synthase